MFVSGNKTEQEMWSNDAVAGKYLRFQFAESIIIGYLKWYQESAVTHGAFKAQGSDDGISWYDIGSSFTLGGATTQEINISANVTPYTYYQLIGVSGSMNSGTWLYEMEFSWIYPVPRDIKTIDGVAYADIKSVDGILMVDVKNFNTVS